MCAEFERLTTLNVVDCLQDLMSKYAVAIVAYAEQCTKPKMPIVAEQLSSVKSSATQEQKRGNDVP